MYKLEHLNPQQANGLPLYPVRVVPTPRTHNDYYNIKEWCRTRNIFVHIPEEQYYFYFNSEQDATYFILGYTGL